MYFNQIFEHPSESYPLANSENAMLVETIKDDVFKNMQDLSNWRIEKRTVNAAWHYQSGSCTQIRKIN